MPALDLIGGGNPDPEFSEISRPGFPAHDRSCAFRGNDNESSCFFDFIITLEFEPVSAKIIFHTHVFPLISPHFFTDFPAFIIPNPSSPFILTFKKTPISPKCIFYIYVL